MQTRETELAQVEAQRKEWAAEKKRRDADEAADRKSRAAEEVRIRYHFYSIGIGSV